MNKLEALLKRLIEFGLLTDDEEISVYESLLHIEIQLSPKTKYCEFIDEFNKVTGKKYKPDIESRALYYDNDATYSFPDRITALKNCMLDPWVKDNFTVLTPKWILKPDSIAKYINFKYASKNNNGSDTKSGSSPKRESVV